MDNDSWFNSLGSVKQNKDNKIITLSDVTRRGTLVVDASNPVEMHTCVCVSKRVCVCVHPKLYSLLVMSALSAPYYT